MKTEKIFFKGTETYLCLPADGVSPEQSAWIRKSWPWLPPCKSPSPKAIHKHPLSLSVLHYCVPDLLQPSSLALLKMGLVWMFLQAYLQVFLNWQQSRSQGQWQKTIENAKLQYLKGGKATYTYPNSLLKYYLSLKLFLSLKKSLYDILKRYIF